MKRATLRSLLMVFLLSSLFIVPAGAQFTFGLTGGAAPAIAPNTNHAIANRANPADEFTFNVADVKSGLYLGVFTELGLDASFFIRAEALYNWYEAEYLLNYTYESRTRSSTESSYSEKVQRIDLPLSLGARIGMFEVLTGLVPRVILKNDNEMSDMDGYSESLDALQLGFQSGVGLNFQNVRLGMTYQMDFRNYGAHMSYRGESLDLQNRPSRILISLGYRF